MKSDNQHIVLSVKNLDIGYRGKKESTIIGSEIGFRLNQGELAALVGANGIGKSTLLRTIAKVQRPIAGEILLKGKHISKQNSIELAASLSLVLTEQIPSKNLTVFELVALGRQPYTNWLGTLSKEDVKKVKESLRMIQLEDISTKKCYELSDGQLQKVMIARALAQDTDLIILDEPTTHLDIYHKAYILKLLSKIAHQTNKTVLFSTHEIEVAMQLCDQMIVMTSDGVISGSPKELVENDTFSTLFPTDLIQFDKNSKSFKVN